MERPYAALLERLRAAYPLDEGVLDDLADHLDALALRVAVLEREADRRRPHDPGWAAAHGGGSTRG